MLCIARVRFKDKIDLNNVDVVWKTVFRKVKDNALCALDAGMTVVVPDPENTIELKVLL